MLAMVRGLTLLILKVKVTIDMYVNKLVNTIETKRLCFLYQTCSHVNLGERMDPTTYGKYTRAPQTVHNTPVMNILKGFFFIQRFSKNNALKKPKSNLKISAQLSMHIGGKFRKMMNGQRDRRLQSDDT